MVSGICMLFSLYLCFSSRRRFIFRRKFPCKPEPFQKLPAKVIFFRALTIKPHDHHLFLEMNRIQPVRYLPSQAVSDLLPVRGGANRSGPVCCNCSEVCIVPAVAFTLRQTWRLFLCIFPRLLSPLRKRYSCFRRVPSFRLFTGFAVLSTTGCLSLQRSAGSELRELQSHENVLITILQPLSFCFLLCGLLRTSTGTCFLLFAGLSEDIPLIGFQLFHSCPVAALPLWRDGIACPWSDESFQRPACRPCNERIHCRYQFNQRQAFSFAGGSLSASANLRCLQVCVITNLFLWASSFPEFASRKTDLQLTP